MMAGGLCDWSGRRGEQEKKPVRTSITAEAQGGGGEQEKKPVRNLYHC